MQRLTPLDTSLRSYSSGGSRGCVLETDDEQLMQELKINMLNNEQRENVEHPQNYGFTSRVPKADMKDEQTIEMCAEHFVQYPGGNRSFPVVEVLDDRRYRIRNFEEGEVAMYDDQQQKVHIQRKRVYGRSPFRFEFHIIKDEPDEDGHGRNPPEKPPTLKIDPESQKPSRDQKKGKPKPLSVFVMDDEWIETHRLDEEGKRLTSIQQGEKKITSTVYKDGRPFLVIDQDADTQLITLQTLKNGRPSLEFALDEDNGEFSFSTGGMAAGESELIMEMNDKEKKITIAIEKDGQTALLIELDGMTEKIKIGDPAKNEIKYPAAREDSITAGGDRLVADLAENVLLP